MAKKRNWRSAEAAERRGEELQQTLERLEEGVRDVFDSGKYREYLAVMSRFHDYSVNNCMLIAMQKPEATLVAGYRAWQDKFGRQVRKGEHGIRILRPVVIKDRPSDDDAREQDDESGEDAAPKRVAGFRLATVFDVSQTEGKDLPSLGIDELKGDVEEFEAAMGAIKKASRYPVAFEDIDGGAKGYFSHAEPKRIVIQEGMSQAQTLKTAVHELAHSVMHDFEPGSKDSPLPDRGTREVQAESVAFVVSSWLGLDTGDYSFGYIASWSDGRDTTELKASLDDIRRASHGIIEVVEREMSSARDSAGGARAREVDRKPERLARSLAERAGAARAASAEGRAPKREIVEERDIIECR